MNYRLLTWLTVFAAAGLGYAMDVTNFHDGEDVGYPLVMLRGDTRAGEDVALSVVNRSSQRESRAMTGLVSKGRFKVFAELVPGRNVLELTHGGETTRLELTYTPQTNPYKVRAVFHTDATGDTTYESQFDEPQDYLARWDAGLKLLQCFTAEWMQRNGYGRRTFNLEFDPAGNVVVHIIKSGKSFDELQKVNGHQAFGMILDDIRRQLPEDAGKFVTLAQIAWSRHDPETGAASGYAALGGGGMALMGGACFYTWPSGVTNIQKTFMSEVPIDTKRFHADGGDVVFRTAGNTLGAALHELGHAFGLPHTNPDAGMGSALMFHGYAMNRYATFADPPWSGNGNRWEAFDEKQEAESIYLAPVSAAALAPSRFFAMRERAYTERNSIGFAIDEAKESVTVRSDDGLAFVCVEIPGAAEDFVPIQSQAETLTELRIPVRETVERYGTDKLTIRVVDAMGHLRHASLNDLIASAPAVDEESAAIPPAIVPAPVVVTMGTGAMPVTKDTRIVVGDASLAPFAAVFADEVRLVTGIKPAVVQNTPAGEGDIELVLLSEAKDEAYTLTVTDRARIQAGSGQGIAYGTTSVVQALTERNGGWGLPRMQVVDEPSRPYRAVLIDVARRWNSPRALRQVIQLARYYKLRYMVLHLTDDHAWTFPSATYPKLGSTNRGFRGPAPRVYTREELEDLVTFADERGVTLVPELATLGHSDQLRIPYPRVFDKYESDQPAHMGVVDMTNPNAYQGLKTLIGEACDIFRSSPFFHIGCDEARLNRNIRDSEHFKSFMAEHGLANEYELFSYFVTQLNGYVKENGKQTMMWSDVMRPGGHGKFGLSDDIILTVWGDPGQAYGFLRAGYDVINACWSPMYQVNMTWDYWDENRDKEQKDQPPRGNVFNYYTPETIYAWNPHQFGEDMMLPTPHMLGAQMTVWEQGGEIHLTTLRRPLAAMAERSWNTGSGLDYGQFEERLERADRRLSALVEPLEPFDDGEVDTPGKRPAAKAKTEEEREVTCPDPFQL